MEVVSASAEIAPPKFAVIALRLASLSPKTMGRKFRFALFHLLTEIRLPLFANKGLSHDRGYWV